MSIDSSGNTQTGNGTGQCATQGSLPQAELQSVSPTPEAMSPMPSPMRVKSLAPLLKRENVGAIMGLSGVKSINVQVTFANGSKDSKTISLTDGGSLALVLLNDNPDRIPSGSFCDIRPSA